MHGELHAMEQMVKEGLPMMFCYMFVLRRLLEERSPALAAHFADEGMDPQFFAGKWFLTAFAGAFREDLVAWTFGVFLAEGWSAIFAVALAMLDLHCEALLDMDLGAMMLFFQELPEKVDTATVMRRAFSLRVTHKRIQAHAEAFAREHAHETSERSADG
jgi:hypothetical protein